MISFEVQGAFCPILIEWYLKILQRENVIEKHSINPDKHLNKESKILISQKAEMDTLDKIQKLWQ